MQQAWERQKQTQNYGRETGMETLQWVLEGILKYILAFGDSSGRGKGPIIGSFELDDKPWVVVTDGELLN